MKNVVERAIDELGRVVLPEDFRRKLHMQTGEKMRLELSGDGIVLKKACPSCVICAETNSLVENEGKHLCIKCFYGFLEKQKSGQK